MTLILNRDLMRSKISTTDHNPPFEQVLVKTISANGAAPSTLYPMCPWGRDSFLLDGSMGGWFDGAFSLLGGTPFGRFQSRGKAARFDYFFNRTKQSFDTKGDPITALQNWLNRFQQAKAYEDAKKEIPFLNGGIVGFFSYDLVQQFEKIPPHLENNRVAPDISLLFLNHFILVDHSKDAVHIVYNPNPDIRMGIEVNSALRAGYRKIDEMERALKNPSPIHARRGWEPFLELKSNCSPQVYIAMVHRAKQYIADGEIFQANLSHRFSAPTQSKPLFRLYRNLCRINPSPFSAYLDLDGIQIASCSPERLVRVKKGSDHIIVETRPIAGTKPRGKSTKEDEALIQSLYGSEKERAEHLMLIDLERNDLGKICRYGSVSVDSMMALEKYSHVSHLVSTISGHLCPGITALEVLKAVFPGGTITGTPKIRCMEIIAALEKQAREIYSGSIGYIGFDGEMDLNIAIRSAIQANNEILFQVGAGIVADSEPLMEYEETLHKAAAFMEAARSF